MRVLNKRLIRGIAIISTVIVGMAVCVLYVQQKSAVRGLITRTYQASATQLANDLAIHVKINDYASMDRLLTQSYLAQKATYVVLKGPNQEDVLSYGQNFSPRECSHALDQARVMYDGQRIGMIEYCYDLEHDAHIKIPLLLVAIIICAILLLTLVIMFTFNIYTGPLVSQR